MRLTICILFFMNLKHRQGYSVFWHKSNGHTVTCLCFLETVDEILDLLADRGHDVLSQSKEQTRKYNHDANDDQHRDKICVAALGVLEILNCTDSFDLHFCHPILNLLHATYLLSLKIYSKQRASEGRGHDNDNDAYKNQNYRQQQLCGSFFTILEHMLSFGAPQF